MACRPVGPGPGAYQLPALVGYERHDNRKQLLPQYSFGLRHSLKDRNLGPGPRAYQVDTLTRYGPNRGFEFTMAGRRVLKDKRYGPGPGAHDVHNKPFFKGVNAPAYSLGLKTKLGAKSIAPGPNCYKVSVAPIKPGSPAYSIGLKTGISKKPRSPGPAAYGLGHPSTVLTRSPEYSLSGRHKIINKMCVPGANNYDLMYHRPGKTGPAYSFGIKHAPCSPPLVVKADNK